VNQRNEELTLFRLKMNVPPDGMSQLNTETKPATARKTALVYVVDDEPMVGDVVQAILKLGGFESVLFADPKTAFKAISEADPKPTLLLTDFQMPQMTGRELIQHCKKVHPELKTILYSGNVQEETVAFYPARPDRFLRKPFTPKTLIDLVQSVLAD
jgi:DNA-binding NtrC family response regulator